MIVLTRTFKCGVGFLLFVTLSTGFLSCVSPKQIAYFQSADTSRLVKLPIVKPKTTRIIPTDILAITVGSLNQESNQILNFANVTGITTSSFPGQTNAQNHQPLGFLVDSSGHVEVPLVGRLHLAGLTLDEANQVVKTAVNKTLKEPAVTIRFLNHKFSVLGEVNRPGTYSLIDDQTTLPEVLAMAGDLTIYGQRSNVLIVREENGVREMARINLLDRNVLNSPYYYIRNRDMIYIEPTKAKATFTDRTIQLVPVVTSVATAIFVLLNFIVK
ncbi:MAG: polysaccharide biosynthesis/export family protein [Spirosomataceae bacterium]